MEMSSDVAAISARLKELDLRPGQRLTAICLFEDHKQCPYKEECDCKCHEEDAYDGEA